MMTPHSLYGGEETIVFDDFFHKYTRLIDGVHHSVPSVTTINDIINKPKLIPWAAKVAAKRSAEMIMPETPYPKEYLMNVWERSRWEHERIKKESGGFGTIVHNWVEDYINGKLPDFPENKALQGSINRFLEWEHKHCVKFHLSEQITYSRKYNYVGTLDAICEINGRLYLFDLKTNNSLYKLSMGCQLSAYVESRMEEFPQEKYAGCILCRVGKKEGDFQIWGFSDWKPYFDMFLSTLNTYKQLEYLKTWKLV